MASHFTTATTEQKIQENAKISKEHAKLTWHIHQVIDHPSTTEIIKITKKGSLPTFPVKQTNLHVDKDIFRVDIGTPKHKTSRDEQFPNIEFQVNCRG